MTPPRAERGLDPHAQSPLAEEFVAHAGPVNCLKVGRKSAGVMVTEAGQLKGTPPADPASVAVRPSSRLTARMRWFFVSATIVVAPSGVTMTPSGPSNRASS